MSAQGVRRGKAALSLKCEFRFTSDSDRTANIELCPVRTNDRDMAQQHEAALFDYFMPQAALATRRCGGV